MSRPLPTILDFGCHVIHIHYVSKKRMAEETDWDPDDGLALADGAWVAEDDAIYIGKWLPLKTQRITLFHEIVHAALDLREWMA